MTGLADLPVALASRIWVNGYGCWEWTGALTEKGYGKVYWAGRTRRVHRVVWELLIGPITPGLELCHRCDFEACCNPACLEEGTSLYNTNQKPGVNKARCIRDHELTPENTRVQVRDGHIHRGCKTCARERKREIRAAIEVAPQSHTDVLSRIGVTRRRSPQENSMNVNDDYEPVRAMVARFSQDLDGVDLVVKAVLDELGYDPDHLRRALAELLPDYCGTRIRVARNVARNDGRRPLVSWKRKSIVEWHQRFLADQLHVADGYRRMADCSFDDLMFAVGERRAQAEVTLLAAAEYERLAGALREHGVVTVGELSAEVVQAALRGES